MNSSLCSFALFVATLAMVNALSCPGPKWTIDAANGRCYWFNNEEDLPSYSADEHCRRFWDGHLISINDMAENSFAFGNFPDTASYAYIGLNDKESEGSYRWYRDNAALAWAGNFEPGFRNNGRYDCIVMKIGSSGDGTWKEVQCNDKHVFICECTAR